MVIDSRRLLELRGDRSQRQIAKEAGIAQGTLSNYESGNAIRPDVESLKKLAAFYGVPLSEIYRPRPEPAAITADDALLLELIGLWVEVPTSLRPALVGLVQKLAETMREGSQPQDHRPQDPGPDSPRR